MIFQNNFRWKEWAYGLETRSNVTSGQRKKGMLYHSRIIKYWKKKENNRENQIQILRPRVFKKIGIKWPSMSHQFWLSNLRVLFVEWVFCYQNFLVIEKNIWNSRLKAENLQNFEITRTIYSNSERSEQFVVTECFLNVFLEVFQIY